VTAPRTIGWKLDRAQRAALLERFVPLWLDVIADHVTLESQTSAPLPGDVEAAIVGEARDDDGLQALVVAIDGTTDRPDGSSYHISWSLDRARGWRAVQSNDVIRRCGWSALDRPVPIKLIPAVL
jgi:hypothetical protein